MVFFMRYREKEYCVRVESRRGELFVRFNDEPEFAADIFFYGNDCSFIQEQKVFFANIIGDKGQYTVWRPEGNLNLGVESEYRRIVGILRGGYLQDENNVYAKMPGKIAKVMVKVGDKIERGTAVIVMEAMKMENEIRALRSGKISIVCVKEGQAVESGALLMEIAPETEG